MTLPSYTVPGGASFPHVTLLPPGSKVAAYVRSGGPRDGEVWPAKDIVTTLDAACNRVRAGLGDVIVVAQDHAESFAIADAVPNLAAGTTIIGLGRGNLRPTFTWSAAAATLLLNVANVKIFNCRMEMAGDPTSTTALTVAAPITVSAAGCGIYGCYIGFGVDVNQLCTIPITTTAAGDDFEFDGNTCLGDTAAECTTFLRLVGADRTVIRNNRIIGATSSVVVGLVQFITTDSLNVLMDKDNHIRNNKAASSAAVSVSAGATSSSGFINELYMTVLDDAAGNMIIADAVGAFGLSGAAFTFGRHVYVANDVAQRMGEVTVVSS